MCKVSGVIEMSQKSDVSYVKEDSKYKGYRFGLDISSCGYSSIIRIYGREGVRPISKLELENEYINTRLAKLISRYREVYRYRIMVSHRYNLFNVVDIDTNQLRSMGINDVDSVYSDLDSVSIYFGSRLGIAESIMEINDFREWCMREFGVDPLYAKGSDYDDWYRDCVKDLEDVVSKIECVLERFYAYYVGGLLTNMGITQYLLGRYNKGLVVGRYHSELDKALLMITIDMGIHMLRDVVVDIAHTFTDDSRDDVVFHDIGGAWYDVSTVSGDGIEWFCNVLEMVAYVNDAMLSYYDKNGIGIYRSVMADGTVDKGLVEKFLDRVGQMFDYCVCNGVLYSYDRGMDDIEISIPIHMLSSKVMASRTFDISRFETFYRDILVDGLERFKD